MKNMPQMLPLSPRRVVTSCLLGLAFLGLSLILLGLPQASSRQAGTASAAPGLPADVNGDGKVDIRDISLVVMRFGTQPDDPGWDSSYDLNNDGIVDLGDVTYSAGAWRDVPTTLPVTDHCGTISADEVWG